MDSNRKQDSQSSQIGLLPIQSPRVNTYDSLKNLPTPQINRNLYRDVTFQQASIRGNSTNQRDSIGVNNVKLNDKFNKPQIDKHLESIKSKAKQMGLQIKSGKSRTKQASLRKSTEIQSVRQQKYTSFKKNRIFPQVNMQDQVVTLSPHGNKLNRRFKNRSFAVNIENSIGVINKLDYTQLKGRRDLIFNSELGNNKGKYPFMNNHGIILQSQRLLADKKTAKYIQRNASIYNQNCSNLSIYLQIHNLFYPNDLKEMPKFHEFMVNVEKTLYFLQDQFQGCALEDILNFLLPESDEPITDIDDSILKIEQNELKKRMSKYNHQFTSFKVMVSDQSHDKNFLMGTKCPICTNQSFESPPLIKGKTANQLAFESDYQKFSKLIDLARQKKTSDQSVRIQFYGENQIIFHNRKMIKKLIRQEVFKRDSSPQKIKITENDPETPRSNKYEGGSSSQGSLENEPNYLREDRVLQMSQRIENLSQFTSQQDVQIEIPINNQIMLDLTNKEIVQGKFKRDKSPYFNQGQDHYYTKRSINLGKSNSSLNISYRETKKPILDVIEPFENNDRSKGLISLESEKKSEMNFNKVQKLPQQLFQNHIDQNQNNNNLMSPVINLTTYNHQPKSSQHFVEFTEIFGENENCDLCGEQFDKHNKDYNFEANLKFERMQEVLNQTHQPTMNITRHNSVIYQQKFVFQPKISSPMNEIQLPEVVMSPTILPRINTFGENNVPNNRMSAIQLGEQNNKGRNSLVKSNGPGFNSLGSQDSKLKRKARLDQKYNFLYQLNTITDKGYQEQPYIEATQLSKFASQNFLTKHDPYFDNPNLCQICFNLEASAECFCTICIMKLQNLSIAQEIGALDMHLTDICKQCGLDSHHKEKGPNHLITPRPQSCHQHLKEIYGITKLKQIRQIYDNDPLLLLHTSQSYQFCVNCDKVLKKYNSNKCQHLSCDQCMLTFCMYCREVIYSFAPGRKHQNYVKDHFNPFSLNSCKMQNSAKSYKSYQEQMKIRENILHTIDQNYQYTESKKTSAKNSNDSIHVNQSNFINISQYLTKQIQKSDNDDINIVFTKNYCLLALCVWLIFGLMLSFMIYPVFSSLNIYNLSFEREKSLYFVEKKNPWIQAAVKTIIGFMIMLVTIPIACPVLYFVILGTLIKLQYQLIK